MEHSETQMTRRYGEHRGGSRQPLPLIRQKAKKKPSTPVATDRLLFPQISIDQKPKSADLQKEENEPLSIILDVKGLNLGKQI